MLRMLFFVCFCLIVYIPHTSIQDDVSASIKNHQLPVQQSITTGNTDVIEHLILWLTEQQYQYETAYYALTLHNVFPNFAKLFHERSEQKYNDVKGIIRLCQILNIDINLNPISSYIAKRPLRFLSPDRLNKTSMIDFFSNLTSYECNTTFTHLSNAYRYQINMAVSLKMYLREKLFMKQILTCKFTSDLNVQLDRFIETDSNDRSIPFSFIFADSVANLML